MKDLKIVEQSYYGDCEREETKARFIEVKVYGDFDMQFSHSIWYGSGEIPEAEDPRNTNDPEKYIKLLKRRGYKELKTTAVEFGGNL